MLNYNSLSVGYTNLILLKVEKYESQLEIMYSNF